MHKTSHINYKALRKLNPEAARVAVIDYWKSSGKNVCQAAHMFGIQRKVVYAILNKHKENNLKDSSKRPHSSPRKTPQEKEKQIVQISRRTNLPLKKLQKHLAETKGIVIPYGTLRHILRRHNFPANKKSV